jgi:hypothetical protein
MAGKNDDDGVSGACDFTLGEDGAPILPLNWVGLIGNPVHSDNRNVTLSVHVAFSLVDNGLLRIPMKSPGAATSGG